MKNILIVDEDPSQVASIYASVSKIFPNAYIEIDGNRTIEMSKYRQQQYDLVIMETEPFGGFGEQLIGDLNLFYPTAPILVYSKSDERRFALLSLRAGAKGFVSKKADKTEVEKAIQDVIDGKFYISDGVQELSYKLALNLNSSAGRRSATLSAIEQRIAEHIVRGLLFTEISRQEQLSLSSIYRYRRSIFKKLRVNDVTELNLALEFTS